MLAQGGAGLPVRVVAAALSHTHCSSRNSSCGSSSGSWILLWQSVTHRSSDCSMRGVECGREAVWWRVHVGCVEGRVALEEETMQNQDCRLHVILAACHHRCGA